jgi:ABC-type transport system involved in cytochrome bd biosynthesis fused ATPase/permease subunit
MRKLDDALERQQAIQRKRTIAWILFAVLAPVSLLFWLEVVFALGHLPEIGILQLLAELLLALIASFTAVQAYQSGMQYNKLIADTSRLLDDEAE